jgi:hypothetical protein
MYRALITKELRETWWIGLLVGGAMLLFCLSEMGLLFEDHWPFVYWRQNVEPGWVHPIPFQTGGWVEVVLTFGAIAAVAMALWQTLGESAQGTWILLLHRPASRKWIILMKAAIGCGWLLLCLGLPLFIYSLWAAAPATHAAPFYWWMVIPTMEAWAFLTVSYLAAFLCGLRPARWWVSRFFPAVAAALLWLPIAIAPWQPIWFWLVFATALALFLPAILYTAQQRDYA